MYTSGVGAPGICSAPRVVTVSPTASVGLPGEQWQQAVEVLTHPAQGFLV